MPIERFPLNKYCMLPKCPASVTPCYIYTLLGGSLEEGQAMLTPQDPHEKILCQLNRVTRGLTFQKFVTVSMYLPT